MWPCNFSVYAVCVWCVMSGVLCDVFCLRLCGELCGVLCGEKARPARTEFRGTVQIWIFRRIGVFWVSFEKKELKGFNRIAVGLGCVGCVGCSETLTQPTQSVGERRSEREWDKETRTERERKRTEESRREQERASQQGPESSIRQRRLLRAL